MLWQSAKEDVPLTCTQLMTRFRTKTDHSGYSSGQKLGTARQRPTQHRVIFLEIHLPLGCGDAETVNRHDRSNGPGQIAPSAVCPQSLHAFVHRHANGYFAGDCGGFFFFAGTSAIMNRFPGIGFSCCSFADGVDGFVGSVVMVLVWLPRQ